MCGFGTYNVKMWPTSLNFTQHLITNLTNKLLHIYFQGNFHEKKPPRQIMQHCEKIETGCCDKKSALI